ncbi:MAG: hypothetical protein ACXVBG_24380 [Isosphaeraceae bacterium]
MTQLPVHNFSNRMLNPGIGYFMSCLGACSRCSSARASSRFVLSLIIAMSPNKEEIRADASLSERLAPEPAPQLE